LSFAGDGLSPVRRSLIFSPQWYDSRLAAGEVRMRGSAVEDALSSERALIVPRVPGIDEYIAALDQKVSAALSVAVPPDQALAEAARKWEEITDARGRDAQRAAYWKHLGIGD
jgi:hypothetical protein